MEKIERFQAAYNYLYGKGAFHNKTECAKILGRSRAHVSEAYSGRAPYFNDRFLKSFVSAFPEISLEWLINGTGEMLVKKEEPEQPKDILIDIYAQLIRRVDDLRIQLDAELKAVHEERMQLHAYITQFAKFAKVTPYASEEVATLKVAEK